MDRRIRIVVADDHPVVREGLAAVIARETDMVVVGAARDGREALELSRSHSPDVVLMDLRMPVLDGVTATALVRRECPGTHVIVLTTFGGDADIHRALEAGARAYLLKDADARAVLAAIRDVHAGRRHLGAEVSARLMQRYESDELTPRETEILTLIAKGMKNRQIAKALGITEGTVKGHINNILGKLHVRDRTQAVTVALRRGIVHLD